MANRNKRDTNFASMEVELLYENVSNLGKILENKKTDNSSNAAKKKAWEDMSVEFSRNGYNRTWSQLESKWKGLKAVR